MQQHYVVDWSKVQTLDDVKRILQKLDFSFSPNVDVKNIEDLVRLENIQPERGAIQLAIGPTNVRAAGP